MPRAFWPGFEWRLLAHRRTNIGRATIENYVTENGPIAVRSRDFDTPAEFDELVIDHWFHLEQMSDRDWWIGVGSYEDGSDFWHINIRIDGKKRVHVSLDQEHSRDGA